ncbi:rRNA biogenesis protein rrp5 [Coemansia interrupta]|uniref:rRNA biogenesis protein rrp5 n=1 Tax=Coemansia interrupta TaxID=1126814 RepID=A0A9W8LL99_9FUNG|nr:rRNA biogenesis protein rrp5 [Coemansia interrupta]
MVDTKSSDKKAPKNKKHSAEITGDFPRGGSSALTPLELREISRQAEREVLFTDGVTSTVSGSKRRHNVDDAESGSADAQRKIKKKSKKPSAKTSEAAAAEDDADDDIENVSPVESLSFKKLTKGAMLLGCISAIQDLQLRVSLPNGLVGVVPITSISPELTALVEKAAEEDEDDSDDDSMEVDSESKDDPLDLGSRFYIGQYVKCVIAELGGNSNDSSGRKSNKDKAKTGFSPSHRIELTLVPEEINNRIAPDDLCVGQILTASVKSAEDRGYVLNAGFASNVNTAVFLPTSAANAWIERWMPESSELRVGQLVEAAVTKISSDKRSIQVSIDPTTVAQSTVRDFYKTMASVQPGQLIPATIMKIWDRGLSLRFMGFYDCCADLTGIGMASATDKKSIEETYKPASSVDVRVLYVSLTAAAKTVIVSTLPHIVSLSPRPALTGYENSKAARLATIDETDAAVEADGTSKDDGLWPIPYGTVIDGCTVENATNKVGVLLQIPSVSSVKAFATSANLVDEGSNRPTINRHSGSYRIGTIHRVRVIGYDAIDAVVRVSLRPSVVEERFFSFADVKPGDVINGTCKRLSDNGLDVSISSNIRGFVHRGDLSDTKLKHPELLFKEGKSVACRVLKVLKDKQSILLTCRKSLVQSKLPVVYGYTEAEGAVPGAITMATIDRETKGGHIVSFYQGTHGFVAADPSKKLSAGQAIKCRILWTNPEKRRIAISVNTDNDVELDELLQKSRANSNTEFSTDLSQVSTGQVVSGTVTRVHDDYIMVRLDGSNVRASVPKGHLSDHCGAILNTIIARISTGTHLPELVITNVLESKGRVNASAKPALIKAAKAGCLPASTEEFVAGKTLVGWVSNTATFGVFVSFANSVTVLAPLDMLSDRYVAAPSELFFRDQTVVVSVTKVEKEESGSKVFVSLKGSAADPEATGFVGPTDYLLGYFDALEGNAESAVVDAIGTKLQITVKQKLPYGLVVSPVGGDILPQSFSGFITADQAKEKIDQVSEGTVVAACVLDVDSNKKIADCSLRGALVDANASAKGKDGLKALSKAVKKTQETDVVVEIIKEDYLVLSMPQFGNAIAFASTKTYNDCSKPFTRYKVGQSLKGVPVRVGGSGKRTLVVLRRGSDSDINTSRSAGDKRAAVDPIDPAVAYFEDCQPGARFKARVVDISGSQANLELASNIKARLHISELMDDISSAAASAKSPDEVFESAGVSAGKTILVKLLGVHNSKTEKFLPVTHRLSPQKTTIEATIRPSEMAAATAGTVLGDEIRLITTNTIEVGQVVRGFVKGVTEANGPQVASVMIYVGLSLVGFLPITAATSSIAVASSPEQYFTPGLPIEVQVAEVNTKSNFVMLLPHGKYAAGIEKPLTSLEQLVPGARVITSVTGANAFSLFTGINVVVTDADSGISSVEFVHGNIHQFNIADTLSSSLLEKYTKGQVLEAVVLDVSNSGSANNMRVNLSLRPSVLSPEEHPASEVEDPLIGSASDVSVGQIIHGFVRNTTDVGCFITVGPKMTARAIISELSDEYIRDVKSAFPVGKLVTAVVIDTNASSNKISLSLRASRIGSSDSSANITQRRLDQIEIGETLKGTITRIEHYGVFIKPDDSFVTGLCYVREIADSDVPPDPKALYELGDRVLAKVLKVDAAANRLALGLKASYFAKESNADSDDDEEEDGSDDEEEASNASEDDVEDHSDNSAESDDNMDASDDVDSASSDAHDAESDSDVEMEDVSKPALAVSGGFQWGDDAADSDAASSRASDSDSDSGDDEGDDARQLKKKSKKDKRSKMQKVTQDITAELSEQTPQAAADFERLIVGSPNSSFIWLQFMAYYLSQSEIEQARAVAERALKTIVPSEEQEKMNVWVALLNLEHRFGTRDSLEAALKRATQFMNPKHVYLQMAKIYERADQYADAESMHKTAISKFSGSCKVWVLFGLFYLKNNKVTESRDLLARALRTLPKRKHIKAITQFGQMEFKHGEPERGRTVFEGILGTYPKRVDLWSVYLDMEIKAASASGSDSDAQRWDPARKLFARVTSMKHSSKKMKFFFKKWLAFEKSHGSDETVEHVKQKALEYVNSLSS